jgi:hypothetical protein
VLAGTVEHGDSMEHAGLSLTDGGNPPTTAEAVILKVNDSASTEQAY